MNIGFLQSSRKIGSRSQSLLGGRGVQQAENSRRKKDKVEHLSLKQNLSFTIILLRTFLSDF